MITSCTIISSYDSSLAFPSLPVELVREIIELAAILERSSALNLALVSKIVKNWVTPLLYHTVALQSREGILAFIQGLEAALCVSVDNTKDVYSLSIHKHAMRHCDWTLSLCRDVQRLLLWPSHLDQSLLDNVEGASLWPRPWCVVLLEAPTLWLSQRMSLFAHTTHLYVDEVLQPSILQLCAEMPFLTHICFGLWGDQDCEEVALQGTKFLLEMPLMKLVLIQAFISGASIEDFYGGVWEHLAQITDERLILMPGMSHEEIFELFESGIMVWDSIPQEWKDWRETIVIDGGLSPLKVEVHHTVLIGTNIHLIKASLKRQSLD